MSRRRFIKNSSYAAGGVIGGGFLGTILGRNLSSNGGGGGGLGTSGGSGEQATEDPNFNQALTYFNNQADFAILSAATERIFPEDDNGPGAIALGVPFFIDHQLAGGYGHNEREYMQGPFAGGSQYQGYQTRLRRHEVFMQGIMEMENIAQNEFDGSFGDLEAEQQDEILQRFADDEVELKGVSSAFFFEQLRSATIAGAYADPVYGGNFNMDGWRMKEFPGHQRSYLNQIGEAEEFIVTEPQALRANITQ